MSSPKYICKCLCCPGSGIGIIFGQREQRCLLESVSRVLHPCIMPVQSQHKKKMWSICSMLSLPPKKKLSLSKNIQTWKRDVFTFAVSSHTYVQTSWPFLLWHWFCESFHRIRTSSWFWIKTYFFYFPISFHKLLEFVITFASVFHCGRLHPVGIFEDIPHPESVKWPEIQCPKKDNYIWTKKNFTIFSGLEPPMLHWLGTNRVDQ